LFALDGFRTLVFSASLAKLRFNNSATQQQILMIMA